MISSSIAQVFAKIVGTKWVLTDPAELTCYARDASVASGRPAAVVVPGSSAEVSAVLKAAAEASIPVTPRGAGTGLAGGAVPMEGIVLALTRLRGLSVHKRDLVASVGAGVATQDLHAAAENEGLFYPPDPSSASVCTIGGNVATNAGGPHGFKYGVTRDYLLGLEVVLSDGTLIQTGGRTLKNAAGYSLTQLLCGSEGTLGVVTNALLRLIPLPEERAGVLSVFDDLGAAAQAVLEIINGGICPSALEIMDRTTLSCAARDIWPAPPAAALLVEIDGPLEVVLRRAWETETVCRGCGARKANTASGGEASDFAGLRRAVSGSLTRLFPLKIGEDVAVPLGMLPSFIDMMGSLSADTGVKIAVFGHAADGNLHPNILFDPRDIDAVQVEAAIEGIFQAAFKCGGALSGEHGVGMLKSPFFEQAVGPETIALMRGIKKVFDPHGQLNPGKIWPHGE
ncbi:MAG: FAD-linked oxidase C-terminal domain-containing protein [Bacillota bacterium]